MMHSDLRLNGALIRFDANLLPTIEPRLFNEQWLRANRFWQGSTQGRSQAHFFRYMGTEMVLRHFNRGGLIGRMNRDLYFGVGGANSRALREFDLLSEMHAQGLPVPLPVAAQYVPFGPFYHADIITQRIAHAHPLQDVLGERALSAQLWTAIGANVRNLHDHGFFHSDLNCRNILIDASDRIWFIDFDKCDKRKLGAWTQANLDRLHRSLTKTARQKEGVNWNEGDWTDFLAGYDGAVRNNG